MIKGLASLYRKRFGHDAAFRMGMWKTLCENFFQRYIPPEACVADIGAGYCEFINHIKCSKKIAVDTNEDTRRFAAKDVDVVACDCTDMKTIADQAVDVAFVSHLFEHLTKEEIIKTLGEIRRILKMGGKLLILQPNIRYCYRDYWMFLDHITPLDDRSIREVLELMKFTVVESRPKFLPFTTKSALRHFSFLLRLYLNMPLAWHLFGQQAFMVARKEDA